VTLVSSSYVPFSADGHEVRWRTWDGAHDEVLTLTWENEGWTASGLVGRERLQYVLRISPTWQTRQFLLFRDLDEPDLWLGTDGHGGWGEINGAYRRELDGCVDLHLVCTPFTATLPIRRLPLMPGDGVELRSVRVDPETLGVRPLRQRYLRLEEHRWSYTDLDTNVEVLLDVDRHGVVVDVPGEWRRVDPAVGS
jgi:uncharacterized protein